jgi:hypothetical protein
VSISTLNMSPDENVISDLASGQLKLPATHLDRGLPYFELSRDPVVVGEEVVAIGHALVPGQTFADGGLFTITGGLTMLHEPVVETYDKWTNLPASVFRLDCEMPGGMSGGPILRSGTGEVVGVCAYALGPDSKEHEPYCYGSMLTPLMGTIWAWRRQLAPELTRLTLLMEEHHRRPSVGCTTNMPCNTAIPASKQASKKASKQTSHSIMRCELHVDCDR